MIISTRLRRRTKPENLQTIPPPGRRQDPRGWAKARRRLRAHVVHNSAVHIKVVSWQSAHPSGVSGLVMGGWCSKSRARSIFVILSQSPHKKNRPTKGTRRSRRTANQHMARREATCGQLAWNLWSQSTELGVAPRRHCPRVRHCRLWLLYKLVVGHRAECTVQPARTKPLPSVWPRHLASGA